MTIKQITNISLLFLLSNFYDNFIYAQTHRFFPYRTIDEKSYNLALDSIIKKDFYIDSTKSVRVIFECRVDSLGFVHSAHVTRSTNIKEEYNNFICFELENNINLKFLYTKYDYAYHDRINCIRLTVPYPMRF
jgi:hypothetical protein